MWILLCWEVRLELCREVRLDDLSLNLNLFDTFVWSQLQSCYSACGKLLLAFSSFDGRFDLWKVDQSQLEEVEQLRGMALIFLSLREADMQQHDIWYTNKRGRFVLQESNKRGDKRWSHTHKQMERSVAAFWDTEDCGTRVMEIIDVDGSQGPK